MSETMKRELVVVVVGSVLYFLLLCTASYYHANGVWRDMRAESRALERHATDIRVRYEEEILMEVGALGNESEWVWEEAVRRLLQNEGGEGVGGIVRVLEKGVEETGVDVTGEAVAVAAALVVRGRREVGRCAERRVKHEKEWEELKETFWLGMWLGVAGGGVR